MTQSDKELLIKDLCTRLPYGVMCRANEINLDGELFFINKAYNIVSLCNDKASGEFDICPISDIKPYLRPMSSMTEEEKKEFKDTFNGFFQYFNHGIISDSRVWDRNEAVFVGELSCSRLIDWLNTHHFDYRGLIERGIALEAPEDMYKF